MSTGAAEHCFGMLVGKWNIMTNSGQQAQVHCDDVYKEALGAPEHKIMLGASEHRLLGSSFCVAVASKILFSACAGNALLWCFRAQILV